MKLVLTADTHCHSEFPAKMPFPEGDVLIVAGDLTWVGSLKEVNKELEWLANLPCKYKIVVAGNHDYLFQDDPMIARLMVEERGMIYLEDQMTTLEGVTFYGSPWSPQFGRWAFMRERGRPLQERWALIPQGVDVLITHTPPAGILDKNLEGEHCGDVDLLVALRRIQPSMHVFGHIHEAHGMEVGHRTNGLDKTIFINASLTDRQYRPVNPPVVWEIEKP